MTDSPSQQPPQPTDAEAFARNMALVAERSQRALLEFAKRRGETGTGMAPSPFDPLNVAGAFAEATARVLAEPGRMLAAQIDLWQRQLELWQRTVARAVGEEAEPVVKPEPGDRRFRDPEWDANPVFDYIKQSYLLTARSVLDTVASVEGLDEPTGKKVAFYVRQFIDAMAPTNFLLTNPEVLRATRETNGENLVRGLDNLLADLERSKSELMVKMTDLDAFQVGRNVAVTPGKVVYQNEVMQLIQYSPTTEEVFERPLLIVPPWINKYYILDLRPDNSFIRWCVDQGYTVFLISWVNPPPELADKTFEDYMFEGPLAALDAIEQATGQPEASAVGYCIGGTLMASTLAYMSAREDDRVAACTFFAAQTDFTEAGELCVFIDEQQVEYLERRMEQSGGLLDASAMASAFNMLRANDLIWTFVVNNYLLGREPLPFDLLYWNSDSTRIPARMHSYYLRNMYLENRLVQPGALHLGGVPIDLTRVKTPIYMQAAREDHIAPYPSVFKGVHQFRGPLRFVLAGSGHIAGVVNPPAANKYQHWVNDSLDYARAQDWLADAEERPGSWWPDWHAWLSERSGKKIPARAPGDGGLTPVEDAPGSYVLERS